MYFIAKALDRPGVSKIRGDLHPRHKVHLDAAVADTKVIISGPLVGMDGEPEGSFFIYEAETPEAVRRFMDQDPFAQAGVWSSLEIHAFDWRRGKPPV